MDMADNPYQSWKVSDMREELRRRGEDSTGEKEDLLFRLLAFAGEPVVEDSQGGAAAADVDAAATQDPYGLNDGSALLMADVEEVDDLDEEREGIDMDIYGGIKDECENDVVQELQDSQTGAFHGSPPPDSGLNCASAAATLPTLAEQSQLGCLRTMLAGGVCDALNIQYPTLVDRLLPLVHGEDGSVGASIADEVIDLEDEMQDGNIVEDCEQETAADAGGSEDDTNLFVIDVGCQGSRSASASAEDVQQNQGNQVVVDAVEADAVEINAADADTVQEAAATPAPLVAEDLHNAVASPTEEGDLDVAYSSPTAPLALLRAYASRKQWFGTVGGSVVFDADGVRYSGSTMTPLREHPWEDRPGLSLATLSLLAALGSKYCSSATPQVLQRFRAARIADRYVPELLEYITGTRDGCELLPAELGDFGDLPKAVPHKLLARRRSARLPLSVAELMQINCTISPSIPSSGVKDVAGPVKSTLSPAPTQSMAERLEQLRLDIERQRNVDPVITGGTATPPQDPEESSGTDVDIAALKEQVAEAVKQTVLAEATLRRREAEEEMLSRLLVECAEMLQQTAREMKGSLARVRDLHSVDGDLLPSTATAKRRRVSHRGSRTLSTDAAQVSRPPAA